MIIVIFDDLEKQIFFDDINLKFTIKDFTGEIIEHFQIEDEILLGCIEYDVIDNFKKINFNNCKNCDAIIYHEKYCGVKCKNQYNYKLRKHETYVLSEEIEQIKQRVDNCEYCGKKLKEKHADHILPLQEYSDNHYDNIAIVCASCNCSKSNKDLLNWADEKKIILSKHISNHYYYLKRLKGQNL